MPFKYLYKSKKRISRLSCTRSYCDIFPSSVVRIIKPKGEKVTANLEKVSKPAETEENKSYSLNKESKEFRVNDVNIQMISRNLYEQLFASTKSNVDGETIKRCQENLRRHGINYEMPEKLPDVELQLPKLQGKDIVEHFYNIGEKQSAPYRKLLETLASCEIPPMPKTWLKRRGWHRYKDGQAIPVPCPPDDALVLDVEVLMCAGKRPTLACAVSPEAWYGWVSDEVVNNGPHHHHPTVTYESLIPLETDGDEPSGDITRPRIVVGHNVSYDRTKIKEQYWLERTGVRFMDTMSMHISVSGVTSYQRAMMKSKSRDDDDEEWMENSSLNSLSDVHQLYCSTRVDKQSRDVFVCGTFEDVVSQFQRVMAYCAGDVIATWRVLARLYPLFVERFPHPVTLAGMLELGSAYLPVNSNWLQYIESAETVFQDCKLETRQLLSLKADEACRLMINEQYKKDLWMWDQDWSTQVLKLKKAKVKKKATMIPKDFTSLPEVTETVENTENLEQDYDCLCEDYIKQIERKNTKIQIDNTKLKMLENKFKYLYDLAELLPVRRPLLPGYPAWYRKLCSKPGKDPDWLPGAHNITTSMQITPKLLRLTWEGYPLHHTPEEKWGFLIPFSRSRPVSYEAEDEPQIPLEELIVKCPVEELKDYEDWHEQTMEKLNKKVEEDMGKRTYYARKKVDETASANKYHGLGVWSGIQLQGCCHFLRLPHKDGPKNKVGNPLAKDFLDMFSQNVLAAQGNDAEQVLNLGRMMSYWRNNKERIMGQQVVWLPEKDDNTLRKYGAIIPQVVVCGTLTRRASEPCWMTASNARPDRVGSELRAMVQAPPGYKLVGADVDSQELWISSLFGDSTYGLPGGTALGWAVVAGSRAANTDLHSLTAAVAGIAREHAKVINYARIYGAGQNFAERLLKQFNPKMTNAEAKSKAMKMFTTTKGRRVYTLKKEYMEGFMDEDLDGKVVEMSGYQATRLAKLSGKQVGEMFDKPKWVGGTESEMFNKLEEMSAGPGASTAFLSARLSRALEHSEGRWDGTKHNWAVQSAAADCLHLMCVCLTEMAPRARFCLSFHDEVRYIVPDEYKYETALALHITNLFTRAFCSQRVGLNDLPMSVAFFTSVEVDQVLRKESDMSCTTPSNPHGLEKGYGIPNGESLSIYQVLEKLKNKVVNQ